MNRERVNGYKTLQNVKHSKLRYHASYCVSIGKVNMTSSLLILSLVILNVDCKSDFDCSTKENIGSDLSISDE